MLSSSLSWHLSSFVCVWFVQLLPKVMNRWSLETKETYLIHFVFDPSVIKAVDLKVEAIGFPCFVNSEGMPTWHWQFDFVCPFGEKVSSTSSPPTPTSFFLHCLSSRCRCHIESCISAQSVFSRFFFFLLYPFVSPPFSSLRVEKGKSSPSWILFCFVIRLTVKSNHSPLELKVGCNRGGKWVSGKMEGRMRSCNVQCRMYILEKRKPSFYNRENITTNVDKSHSVQLTHKSKDSLFIKENNGDIVWYCVLLKNVTKTKGSRMKKESLPGRMNLAQCSVLFNVLSYTCTPSSAS